MVFRNSNESFNLQHEFPVKLRIIINPLTPDSSTQRIHVRDYSLKECDTINIFGNENGGFRSFETLLE